MSCLYDGKGLLCLTVNDAVLFIIDFILPQTISNRFIEKRYEEKTRKKRKSGLISQSTSFLLTFKL